jgi:hypothetical protein
MENGIGRSEGRIAMAKAVPISQPVEDETKQAQSQPPKVGRLVTPQAFYRKLTQREDIRAILSRLAKN